MSPKASELRSPEQAPYGTPDTGLGSKGGWAIAAGKSQKHIRKAEMKPWGFLCEVLGGCCQSEFCAAGLRAGV